MTADERAATSQPPAPVETAPGYASLLRGNRNFRLLWLGDLVSFLGDWFNTIAVYSIVLRISGTGQALAAIMIVKTLPAFLIAPVAGPLVDRFDRKRLLIAADLARVLGVAGLLWARAHESLPGILFCLVAMMACTGIFFPARNAVVPMLTDRRELPVANALAGGTWSLMLAVGSGLGGLATAGLGEAWALVIDGGTFLVSALLLSFLPRLPAPRSRAVTRVAAVAEDGPLSMDDAPRGSDTSFVDGLRYLARTPLIAALIAAKPMISVAAGAILVIPLYAGGLFPGQSGPLYIGLLYTARGVGAVIGSMVLRKIVGDAPRTLRRMILLGYLFMGIGYVLFGAAPSMIMACSALSLAAIGSASVWVFSGTLLQLDGDPAYHGRLFSLEFGVMTLVFSSASWIAGTALDHWGFGAREVASWSGVLMLGPVAAWLAFLLAVRRRRRGAPDDPGTR